MNETKMTRQEALRRIEELKKYIAELDRITEKDIEAFKIFVTAHGTDEVILPVYSTGAPKYILGGNRGLHRVYSDEPMTAKEMADLLSRTGSKKTNKVLAVTEV